MHEVQERAVSTPTDADLKQWLVAQVAAAAGISEEEVGLEETFQSMGLDSVDHFTIAGELAEWLQCTVPSNLLFEHKTILEVVAELRSSSTPGMECLVEMVAGDGSLAPLYLVHSLAGDLMDWSEFQEQLGSRPVIGIQQPFDPNQSDDETPLEQLVQSYVGPMMAHRTEGPFCIVGHSYGARVAFELARQLLERGREVPLLVIMDGWPVPRRQATFGECIRATPAFLRNLPRWIRDDLMQSGVDKLRARLARKLHSWQRAHRSGPKADDQGRGDRMEIEDFFDVSHLPEQILRRKRANLRSWANYVPEITEVRVELFRSRTRPLFHSLLDPTSGWTPYASMGVEVHHVAGHHTNMNRAPHARELAALLERVTAAALS